MPRRKPDTESAPHSRRLEDLGETGVWRRKRAEREARDERERQKHERKEKIQPPKDKPS